MRLFEFLDADVSEMDRSPFGLEADLTLVDSVGTGLTDKRAV